MTLDTAHGRQNFSFEVARRFLDQGVMPDTISTDLTIPGREHTVHSMTEMLSRFLALGFDLESVVRMATQNPARALDMADTLGSLRVFHDTEGASLKGDKALTPALTVRAGEVFAPDWGPRPWGWLPDAAA